MMNRNSPSTGRFMPTHGKSKTSTYNVWLAMRARCKNENHAHYADYGGRGVYVCDRWESFAYFYEDMGPRPRWHSIERIDNDKGYSKGNCRWATRREQGLNKRNNVLLTIDGETQPLCVWADRFGLKYGTVHQRLTKYGWSPEDAVKTPLVHQKYRIKRKRAQNGIVFKDDEERAA